MANGDEKDLGVVIGFFIDESKEIHDINQTIKRIEGKLEKLNIAINIDKEALRELQTSLQSINRISDESFKKLTQETTKATQASEKHEQQLKEEARAVRELARESDNLRKIITKTTGSGEIKQQQIVTGDKIDSRTIIGKPLNDGSFITREIVEVFDKEKLEEARKYYEEFATNFTKRIGQVENILGPTNEKIRQLVNNFEQLNERSSKTDFRHIERQLKDLEKEAKNYYEMLKLEDRAWRENQKRDEDFLNRRKKLEIQIADIRRRFGADPEVLKGLDELEKKLMSVSKIGNYKQAFNDINTELKNIQANAKTATSHIISLSEAIRTAFVKFPVWLFSGTVIMQTIRFFEYGFRYAVEMDSKLNEIAIVLGKNQEEVRELAREYNELAKQMGVTTREIANASVEFYRQGLAQEEVMERLKTTTQYAKISSLEFKDAAEILTATVNSMGVDIERASDVFAYLGGIRPLAS